MRVKATAQWLGWKKRFQANAKCEEIIAYQKWMSSHSAGCCVQYLDAEVQANPEGHTLYTRSVSALDYLPIVIIYPTNGRVFPSTIS